MSTLPISAVILAGGLGRRMGGVDKGLQLLAGKPLVQWVIERIAPQVDELLINANRNVTSYAHFGHPVIADLIPGFAGPLAGLHAALGRATHPLVLTVPCDSPFLPLDLAARLRSALVDSGADLVSARSGGQAQPAFSICRRELLPRLDSFLSAGGRKLACWQQSVGAVELAFDDQTEAFRNFNRVEDLSEMEHGSCRDFLQSSGA